ncbi:MAG TPA: porin [Steroidobacteraceae bacterium]|nr:porin [Steroidobacteraceae bacterium]
MLASATHADPLELRLDESSLTIESFGNLTAGYAPAADESARDDDLRFDGALRLLGRHDFAKGPGVGARIVVRTSPEDRFELGEASALVFGKSGRLEIGDRQGLPDVLLGYAPNNFTFTGAEFGPASGPSLDPGGGLQLAFLDRTLARQLAPLTSLGFTASQAADESAKVLYVSPKQGGFLAGVSYAPNATDRRFSDLVQVGLTHDTYWSDNVLHVGGSYSFAKGDRISDVQRVRDLHSINVGATLVLAYDLQIGLSVTYDGTSGLPIAASTLPAADAIGAVMSVNYNRGPWTIGAYTQWAQAEGDIDARGNDILRATEAGVSYRTSTHLRIYGAYYRYDFEDEGAQWAGGRVDGGVFVLGMRANL